MNYELKSSAPYHRESEIWKSGQYPIYPEIRISKEVVTHKSHKVILTTTVRVLNKEDGLWYKVLVKAGYILASEIELFEHFKCFHRLVYATQLFHKVNLEVMNDRGEPIYRADDDQRTENERLYSTLNN